MSNAPIIQKFYRDAETYWRANVSQRYGQALFNYLWIVRPDLANSIRGTLADPFNVPGLTGERLTLFGQFILDNWER